MWQKCPICNGTGQDPNIMLTCMVCGGNKIISEITGLPPVDGIGSGKTDHVLGMLEKMQENL